MASNPFDQFDTVSESSGNPFDQFDDKPAPEKSSILRRAGDYGISALKGAIAVPEAAVGLADIVTGGAAGKAAESVGFRPREAKEILDTYLSPEQQAANKAVSDAKGFLPTIGAAVKNPSTIAHTVAESIPSMLGGGVIARGVSKLLPAVTPVIAGAIGEGAVGAGSAAENVRQQTDDGLLGVKEIAPVVASGIGTAAFGAAGGRIAQKLGIADVDTMLAQGGAGATQKGIARRIIEGGISEGVFEELPQSVQEQIWQNVALDKPLLEGVPESGALGLLAGGVMGGVASGAFTNKRGQTQPAAPAAEQAQPEQPALGLPNYPNEPLISFPDGSAGTQSQAEEYINGLPEDQRIQARAALYGYAPEAAAKIQEEVNKNPALLLPNARNETLVGFPDGSIGTRAQAEEYINGLPESERMAKRAALLGYAPQPATPAGPLARAAQKVIPTAPIIPAGADNATIENAAAGLAPEVSGLEPDLGTGSLGDRAESERGSAGIPLAGAEQPPPVLRGNVADGALSTTSERNEGEQNAEGRIESQRESTPIMVGEKVVTRGPVETSIREQAQAENVAAEEVGRNNSERNRTSENPSTAVDAQTEPSNPVVSQIAPNVDDKSPSIDNQTQPDSQPSAPTLTTNDGLRPIVESIAKRRAVAEGQLGKNKAYGRILAAAKDMMNGQPVKLGRLRIDVNELKGDKELHAAGKRLIEIASAPAKQATESRAQTAESYRKRIDEAKTKDELNALASEIQKDESLTDQQAQDLDDAVFERVDRFAEPAKKAAVSQPFDSESFDKARENRINESKESGNTHLDQVPAYVETMRGKAIYYVHDPKVRGVIRTVDNSGNVYVDWSDKYSADKELASPSQEKRGKKSVTVYRTSLGTSDLKDYVFGNGSSAAKPVSQQKTEKAPEAKQEKAPEQPEESADDARKAEIEIARSNRAKAMITERMKLSPFTDDLFAAMAKLGGLNKDEAVSEFGLDQADLAKYRTGILFSFTNGKRALTPDGMREALAQYGYDVGDTVAEFGDKLDNAIRGIQQERTQEDAVAEKIQAFEESQQQYADAYDALSDRDQETVDQIVDAAIAAIGDTQVSAIMAEVANDNPGESINTAFFRTQLKERVNDHIAAQEAREQAGANAEAEAGTTAENRGGESGVSPDVRQEASADLLGDNTATRQSLADAARAKDQKRNSGESNPDDFTLTGSERPADQAIARGARDLFDQPDEVSKAKEALNAAGVTGTDKLNTIAQVRDGKLTAEEVAEAHGVELDEQPVVTAPIARTDYADRIHTLAVHKDLFNRVYEGNVTADELKASFDGLLKNKDGIIAELSGMTKPQIFKQFPDIEYRYKNEKKDRVVTAAYRDMLDYFVMGQSVSYVMGEKYDDVIRRMVDKVTDEQLANFAQRVKKSTEERQAAIAERTAGMQNPQTLEDYTNLLRGIMAEGKTLGEARMTMTPEQREQYDTLAAAKSRSERADRKNNQKTAVQATVTTTTGDIIETKHTKTGEDLFVVKAAERVERDVYNQWNTTAKRLGGWYSSFRGNGAVPGFQFKTRESAEAFLQYLGGDVEQAKETLQARRDTFADDRSQSAVERLTEMADKLEERADASLGQERKANTARRARFAASAEAAASGDKAMAQTMRNIASGIENGTVQLLDQVRQKVQVEMLQGMVRTAHDEQLRKLYPSYADLEKHRGEKPTKEVADFVTYPAYTAYRSDLASLGRSLLETEGTKKLGQRIMSVADDVTEAYLKFARENLHKVSRFSVTGSSAPAVFPSKAEAEKVIARSGFNGKAIVLPFKRGQNIIIISPSEAMKNGIWEGDNDKRITLSGDFGEELVEKLGKVNRSRGRNTINVPWQFENAYDKRKRLAGMGIETPQELRAAIREFVDLREAPKEADKIKQMERAMIGRRNDGLDFFPTPASVADEMIESADLKEGMAVLEPSAGMGHIADRIREAGIEPEVVELSGDRRELLQEKGFNIVGHDFMDVQSETGYDRIIMNPPFGDRRDAAHVQHAYDLLKPGGRIVAIMGEGVFFGQDKKAQAFRDWLEQVGASDEKLEEGTFLDPSLPVNTGVNARMVVIDKPESAKYSRSTGTGTGIQLAKAQSLAADLAKKFPNLPAAIVVQSQSEIPEVKRDIDRALDEFKATGTEASYSKLKRVSKNDIEGAYIDGKFYLVAGNISSEARLREVFAHEGIGHLSVESMLNEVDPRMMPKLVNQVRMLDAGGNKYIRQLAKEVDKRQPGLDKETRAKEIIAFIAERGDQDVEMTSAVRSLWQRIVDGIKAFAKLVFDVDLTDRDVRDIVAMAARYAKGEDVVSLYAAGESVMFSRANRKPSKDAGDTFVSAAMEYLARDTDLFQRPSTEVKDIYGIAKEIDPGYRVEKLGPSMTKERGVERAWEVFVPGSNVRSGVIMTNYEEVWVDVSRLQSGIDSGSAIYDMAASYAHNNGKVLKGDPLGLSRMAYYRRNENMLSSALKYGTTRHLRPALEQEMPAEKFIGHEKAFGESVRPLKWVEGDDVNNIREMIYNSWKAAIDNVPELKDVIYDPATQQFQYTDGRPFTDQDSERIAAELARPGNPYRAGSATQKRAALFNTFLRESGREGRKQVLGALVDQLSRGGLSPALQGILYSRSAADAGIPSAEPQSEPASKYAELNRKFREEHITLLDKSKKWLKRQLAPGGLLPKSVFDEKIRRDSEFEVIEFDVKHLVGQLERAIQKDYKLSPGELDTKTQELLSDVMAGKIGDVPESTKVALIGMRQYIDQLSTQYIDGLAEQGRMLMQEAERTGDTKLIAEAQERFDLMQVIMGNVGQYVHRSYRAFDDPDWARAVPDATLDAARDYLIQRNLETMTPATAAARAEIVLNEILKNGTAYDNMEAFIRESKLGAKDLSVLKTRKQIAPQIRALLGEYTDPRINFAKSATKMGRLIWNQKFLEKVLDVGMGNFLFTDETKPPEATAKIAADKSEVYSPLNGLWTFPETDQAFKDALGKEQMADWFRKVVQINGMVKYGKTVLSPTTAARNWMSAFFFSVANGHFDLRHMKKSVDGLKEYFTHGGDAAKLAYLRELKQLGVVYDTPYAGEMMRLLADTNLSETLLMSKGKLKIKQALDLATKFYSFGDDFHKIVGFENEKRMWMDTGMPEQQAKEKAAERIRNTYPTYSMVGKGIQSLRRFPLAGTFVSFPAEIIRTSINMVRYLAEDYKDPVTRPIAMRRAAGMAIASSFAYAAQALSMAALGYDDDDEEAVRQMAAPWQRNSNLLFTGRDGNGNIRFLDMSFLDPYNYWKRPIVAVTRGQPFDDALRDVASEILTPFFGVDILAGTIFEVLANKKESGAPVYQGHDDAISQLTDIANHMRKTVQPGIVSNMERTYKALDGEVSFSGKKYDVNDEAAAWVGFRVSTLDPKVALYYRSFDFKDAKAEADKSLRDVIRNPKGVDSEDLRDAYDMTNKLRERAYQQMSQLVQAGQRSGMTNQQVFQTLKNSGISNQDIFYIRTGMTPRYKVNPQSMREQIMKARGTFGPEVAQEIRKRYAEVAGYQ